MGKTSITQILIGATLIAASFVPGLNVAVWGSMTLSGALFTAGASMAAGGLLSIGVEETQAQVRANPISPLAPIPVVYGRARVGVRWVDIRKSSLQSDDLYLVGAVCAGSQDGSGIHDIADIYFDDRIAIRNPVTDGSFVTDGVTTGDFTPNGVLKGYSGFVAYSVHLGTHAQPVDAQLNSLFPTEWPATSKGAGIAYIVLRLTYKEGVFPTGLPNVSCIVEGQKLFDPRSATTAYSKNPSLCVRDYLTAPYGGSVPQAEVDDSSFEDAANYCDEPINTTGYSGERFICQGVAVNESPRSTVLAELLSSCRGQLVYQGGAFRHLIAQPQAASTFELNEHNIVGEWDVARLGEVPNSATASYVDASNQSQPREVTWPAAGQVNGFLAADNGVLQEARFDLPFTPNRHIAEQICMVSVREARQDVVIGVTVKQEALKVQAGDVVPLTHSTPGFVQKEFRVLALGILPNALVRLTLREYDVDSYTLDTQDTEADLPETSLPDPFTCQPPSALVLTADETTVSTHGAITLARIRAEWTASPDPFLSHYRLRHRPTTSSAWIYEPDIPDDETLAITVPVRDTVEHIVEVRAVNSLGVPSDWVSQTIVPAQVVAGADVTIDALLQSPLNVLVATLGLADAVAYFALYAKIGGYPTTNGLVDGPLDLSHLIDERDRSEPNVISWYAPDGVWHVIAVGKNAEGEPGVRDSDTYLVQAEALTGQISNLGAALVEVAPDDFIHRITWEVDAAIAADPADYTVRIYETIMNHRSEREITSSAIAANTETFDSPEVLPDPDGTFVMYRYRVELIHNVGGVVQNPVYFVPGYYLIPVAS